jgi:hypothetical protein
VIERWWAAKEMDGDHGDDGIPISARRLRVVHVCMTSTVAVPAIYDLIIYNNFTFEYRVTVGRLRHWSTAPLSA